MKEAAPKEGVHWVEAYEDSVVTLSGGNLAGSLTSMDRSRITIHEGSIGNGGLTSFGYSQVDISGGRIDGVVSREYSEVSVFDGIVDNWVWSSENSTLNLSGGLIDGYLVAQGTSTFIIEGNNFSVDGESFGHGELESILGHSPSAEPPRHLTGTLANGDLIDNDFYIGHDARIVLIPEPTTLLLLGLGGLMLRRKR